ncbi:MAG: histidinol-phosphatase HisJ family protein [Clostridia bacterium]|nr:histidinol-phosphatase HisJ family protein [Clostridia bacterium]
MLVDYHVHGMAHGEFKHTLENLEPFVAVAAEKGLNELGFTEHDWFLAELDFSIYGKLQALYPRVKIRIGLELDYKEDEETEFARKALAYPFDYTIGSVHDIKDWPFDHPDHIAQFDIWDKDLLYEKYFSLVAKMADTRLCQVVGHLDLIKVFGFRPAKKITEFLPTALAAIKEAKMAVEINTNGWYKPIKEVYPAEEVLAECFQYDIPITLSSDAHQFCQVGRDFDKAVQLAKKVGYTKIATFHNKEMIIQPL